MVGSDSSHGVSRVVQHKDFYLRGGDMTVLVENHLYRIHSYFFERESLFFRQKFVGSGSNEDEQRGSTDHNAYTLEDVKSDDFARFLWVFYNPKYSVYDAPLETWLSILKLANRWTFDNVKELSVRELEKIEIEPVEKIAIYHDNSISRLYLIPSYIAVCKREKPLSFTEGMKLGMETVLRIAEARERMRLQASESGIRTPTFEDFEDGQVEVLIREIFSLGPRPVVSSPVAPTPNSATGPQSGVPKLGPAPTGHHSRANGTSASRANGGSAADTRVSSVNSTASVVSPQASATAAGTRQTATPAPATPAPATSTTPTGQQEQRAPAGSTTVPQAALAPPPPPSSDKPKDHKGTASQEANSNASLLSPMSGVGEPSSSANSRAGFRDVPINTPVVPPNEHSDDVNANDNVNETERDDSGKDNDGASVMSDVDGGRGGRQGGKNNKRGAKTGNGAGRGGKKN